MALDQAKNFAKVQVSTGYDADDTSIVLESGHGAKLPTPPFNVVWWDATTYPDPSDDPNVEIVRVTGISTDTLTVTRAQEGTSASTKNTAGKTYMMIAGPTAKLVDDLRAPATRFATAFETSTRFSLNTVNGTNTFNTTGLRQESSTSSGHARALVNTGIANLFDKNPRWGGQFQLVYSVFGQGQYLVALGTVTNNTSGFTFSDAHIGFKVVVASGVASLYATQADGSTETASSALTTLVQNDLTEFYIRVNGSSSVDYYWRKNGGAWSSVNLTTNIPSVATSPVNITIGVNNVSTTTNVSFTTGFIWYEKD